MALTRRSVVIALIVLLCLGVGEFWFFAAKRLGFYVNQPLVERKVARRASATAATPPVSPSASSWAAMN